MPTNLVNILDEKSKWDYLAYYTYLDELYNNSRQVKSAFRIIYPPQYIGLVQLAIMIFVSGNISW